MERNKKAEGLNQGVLSKKTMETLNKRHGRVTTKKQKPKKYRVLVAHNTWLETDMKPEKAIKWWNEKTKGNGKIRTIGKGKKDQ